MSSASEPPGPQLEFRSSGASAVVVQKVPADKTERFLELQRSIAQAAHGFAGYQKVEVYPPSTNKGEEWVIVLHFDDQPSLHRWLDSPVRAEWIARFREEIGESRLKKLTTGFGPWFAGHMGDEDDLPPRWKMALTVLLALYPTVMLLGMVMPPTSYYGPALTMFMGNIASVIVLQWFVMPGLTSLLGPWLRANGIERRAFSVVGLLLIVVSLAAMVWLFWLNGG